VNAPGSDAETAPAQDPQQEAAPAFEPQQYVLPLAVRLERAAPPTRTDAMETAARAVLTLLADERAGDDGEWGKAVRLWEDRAIRKVVRRARGAEWRRAAALPGITVTGAVDGLGKDRTGRDRTGGSGHGGSASGTGQGDDGGSASGTGQGDDGASASGGGEDAAHGPAEVRVFPPIPLDGWPKDLARLQVSGTELTDPAPPPQAPAGVPVLWLSPGLEMSAGKAMAQAGHGAQLAWWELSDQERAEWREAGFPLAVRTAADDPAWRGLVGSGLPVVRDAGFTEIAPGSCTVVADHPALRR
jgi:peptidyl-tRNA hydrolase